MLLPRFHMCLKTTNKIEEMFCIFLSEKRKQMLFIIRRKREDKRREGLAESEPEKTPPFSCLFSSLLREKCMRRKNMTGSLLI